MVDMQQESLPKLVNVDQIEPTPRYPKGGAIVKVLLSSRTVGTKTAELGIFIANPGQGSDWHFHPTFVEPGLPEEDLFYVIKGEGTLFFKEDGEVKSMKIKSGDAVFTGHVEHCTKNTGAEPLIIIFARAPITRVKD